jgi:hypothetical protein
MDTSRRIARLTVGPFDSSPPPTRLSRISCRLLLILSSLAGLAGVLKGASSDIVNGVDFYWMIDYRQGLIKRGLIGSLFHPILAMEPWQHALGMVVWIHLAGCAAIVCILAWLFAFAVEWAKSSLDRVTVCLAFLTLMCSPLMPSLGYIVGYLDVYAILFALVGVLLILREQYVTAAIVAGAGPLVHESFVFLWAPIAIMLAWSSVVTKQRVPGKLIAMSFPALSAAMLLALHNQAAATALIQSLPLPPDVRRRAVFQLGLSLSASFDHMRRIEYPGHLANTAIAMAYCLPPSAGILWANGFVNARRWAPRIVSTMLVAILATVAPLMLLAFAWDLSRFLVWADLSSALVLIGWGAPALMPRSGER